MSDIMDYSEDGINKLRKLVGKISDQKLGEKCLDYDSINQEFRNNLLKTVCVGDRDTPEFKEITLAYCDYKQGIIKKTTFEKLKSKYKHLL